MVCVPTDHGRGSSSLGLKIPRNQFEITNLEQQNKTLQGIGLLGFYRLGHVHYPYQETLGGLFRGLQISNSKTKPSKGLVYWEIIGWGMSFIHLRKPLEGYPGELQIHEKGVSDWTSGPAEITPCLIHPSALFFGDILFLKN